MRLGTARHAGSALLAYAFPHAVLLLALGTLGAAIARPAALHADDPMRFIACERTELFFFFRRLWYYMHGRVQSRPEGAPFFGWAG